ncbi:hypothetical protein Q7Z27_01175 [Glaesserella parasuis]|nr:hypothetical protein [Glaesserella parasuis]
MENIKALFNAELSENEKKHHLTMIFLTKLIKNNYMEELSEQDIYTFLEKEIDLRTQYIKVICARHSERNVNILTEAEFVSFMTKAINTDTDIKKQRIKNSVNSAKHLFKSAFSPKNLFEKLKESIR